MLALFPTDHRTVLSLTGKQLQKHLFEEVDDVPFLEMRSQYSTVYSILIEVRQPTI